MADGGSERADGRIVKMEVDYSATVDQRLPECEQLAKVRQPPGAESRRGPPRPRGARGPERASPAVCPRCPRGLDGTFSLHTVAVRGFSGLALQPFPGKASGRPGAPGPHGPAAREWPLTAHARGLSPRSHLALGKKAF